MEFNLKEKQLLQEIVKKYKQGLISGILQGDNITLTPTGCRNKIISSTGGGGGGGVITDGVTVFGDGVNTPLSSPPNQQGGKYRISGGAAWSGIGLIYDVSIIQSYI